MTKKTLQDCETVWCIDSTAEAVGSCGEKCWCTFSKSPKMTSFFLKTNDLVTDEKLLVCLETWGCQIAANLRRRHWISRKLLKARKKLHNKFIFSPKFHRRSNDFVYGKFRLNERKFFWGVDLMIHHDTNLMICN